MWKKRKKNSLSGFPRLDCFAKVAGRKATFSGLNFVAVLLDLQKEKV